MEKEQSARVGLGVMIFKDGKVLIGKRKGSFAAGEYGFPGGHLEHMEGFEECAHRETEEEAGIKIKNVRFQLLGNVKDYAPRHYVQIGLIADWESGEPRVMEPDKCEDWNWYDMNNLPSPLLKMTALMIDSYKEGRNFYDN